MTSNHYICYIRTRSVEREVDVNLADGPSSDMQTGKDKTVKSPVAMTAHDAGTVPSHPKKKQSNTVHSDEFNESPSQHVPRQCEEV